MIAPGETIGIIGGGQLGKMMIHAASRMGYRTVVFSDRADSPACQAANESVIAEYGDLEAIAYFSKICSIVTFEFENIPYKTAQILERETRVRPNWKGLYISQNRIREKQFLNDLNIAAAQFYPVSDFYSFQNAVKEFHHHCILKTAELGYDGKGQYRIDARTPLDFIWPQYSQGEGIVEKLVAFEKEVSVVAARGIHGEFAAFDIAENIHRNGILMKTSAPAALPDSLCREAVAAAHKMMDELGYIGVMAVEFFVTGKGKLLVNEFAPRPHNSGHWTIDACRTGQFEQHIRAICGCPLGCPKMHSRAEMRNLLGSDILQWEKYLCDPFSKLHLYGKKECKPGRKMGHVTKISSL